MLTHWYEADTDEGRFEVVNNQRTFEYAKALGIRGVKSPGCTCATTYACDPGPYTFDLESSQQASEDFLTEMFECHRRVVPVSSGDSGAPWWDDSNPNSYQFAGFYCIGVAGWDSTFSREQIPRSLTGSAFGVRRRDGRSLTFDGVLVASTAGGLEYGLSYYDSMLSQLGSCGLFTLYTAAECAFEADPAWRNANLRHIRSVTLGEGPKLIETRVTGCCKGRCNHESGGAYYGRVQFTLLSEMPWIFTEPTYALQSATFPEIERGANIKFINSWEARPPSGHWREVLTSRKRFPIEIARDGSICRVGGWDWSQTQLGGGHGIVVISSVKEASAVSLDEVETPEEDEKECPQCQVILNWDVDTGARTFETLRWSNNIRWNSDGSFPCDCEITIAGVRVRNEDFNPNPEEGGDPPNTIKNAQFKYMDISSGGEDGDCCFVELFFDSPTTGRWAEAPGKGGFAWKVDGRDPVTHEQLFPPRGCSLKVLNNCPEVEKAEEGVRYEGPDNHVYMGVRGPLYTQPDGFWRSAPNTKGGWGAEKMIWGCYPGTPCAASGQHNNWVPYVVNRDEISTCAQHRVLPIEINTNNNTWKAKGWFHDKIGEFPPEGVDFEIANFQSRDKYLTTEWVETDPGGCVAPGCKSSYSGPKQIFPSFGSDSWEPIYIPQANSDKLDSPFCTPVESISRCGKVTNDSTVYRMAGNLSLRTGAGELRHLQIKGWIQPFDDLPLPCEDPDYWMDKPPDFTLQVPHLPSGVTLHVDSEIEKSSLLYPGGDSEPAVRYVSSGCDKPLEYMFIEPCSTMYFIVEADAYHTAPNAVIDIMFSNFYGASGSLLPAG